MRPINIFALTRIETAADLQRLERQMSGREHFLTIRRWELSSVKSLTEHLMAHMPEAHELMFYYSFQIPKLGKEFDLMRINADTVINIELKSGDVSDESILKQLKQNRYYLASLGKTMRSYTYISSRDRLVRLTGTGKIVDTEWSYLCEDLKRQTDCYTADAEDLFRAENYIISPLAEPERFLQKEYFLTSQQRDIERRILKRIQEDNSCCQGFTGLPGTGKSLLLYDLAMRLSGSRTVCIVHCGSYTKEFDQLNARLKRIDFYQRQDIGQLVSGRYAAILIDEAHRLLKEQLIQIVRYAEAYGIPVIFSYDYEEMISGKEMDKDVIRMVEALPEYTLYRLTNRIRTNGELSSFIQSVMHPVLYVHKRDFGGVRIVYANHPGETELFLKNYTHQGYQYIYSDDRMVLKPERTENAAGGPDKKPGKTDDAVSGIAAEQADCLEFDRVVMVMDEGFYYDSERFLRYDPARKSESGTQSEVRGLFHGLNRAKTGLALIVQNNEPVLDMLLTIVQGNVPDRKQRS